MFGGSIIWNRGETFSKMFPVVFLAIISICLSISSAQELSSDDKGFTALQVVSSSNAKFLNSIFKILSKKEGNIVFSPISIEVILALAYMGARGRTASQIVTGLHLPKDNELIAEGFNTILSLLTGNEEITLKIANKIFTDESILLKREFRRIARESFLSGVESVDFKKNTEEARTKINQWVKGKTNNKIPELFGNGVLNSNTTVVLANAMYFKASWANAFHKQYTRKEKFYLSPTQTKDVQMMNQYVSRFGYAINEELDCQMLEIPYEGEFLSLVVLLPNKLDGLPHLEAKVVTADFHQLIDSLVDTYLEVSLPKFTFEDSTDLTNVLKKYGMDEMFGTRANFSGLTEVPISVSNIAHKAFIEVNEKGTEAAAATGFAYLPQSSIEFIAPPPRFVANHPFLFAIVDKQLRTPLLAGRYAV